MSKFSPRSILAGVAVLAVIGGAAYSAQDKNTVQVPNGLGFAEFKGYEGWQVISLSESRGKVAVILGNPVMIKAYEDGIPANGQPFPDGAKMAKIHWKSNARTDLPAPTTSPGTLVDTDFMVKDSKRFTGASGGWGYAVFNYDDVAHEFKPVGNDAKCGIACHNLAKNKDYVFTDYAPR